MESLRSFRGSSYKVFKDWANKHNWFLVSESAESKTAEWLSPNGPILVEILRDGDTINTVRPMPR